MRLLWVVPAAVLVVSAFGCGTARQPQECPGGICAVEPQASLAKPTYGTQSRSLVDLIERKSQRK